MENVGGGGGTLGGQRVVKAAPDGYTSLLGTVATHANPQLYSDKPLYDPLTDFTPVALIAEIPLIVIVRKEFPANTFAGVHGLCEGQPRQAELWLGGRRLGRRTSAASCSTRRWARTRSTCRIAAPGRRCRT